MTSTPFSTLTLAAGMLLGTVLLYPEHAAAETYRWVDNNGIVNYSERKPKGVDPARLTVIGDKASRRQSRTRELPNADSPTPVAQNTGATEPAPAELNEKQQKMLEDLQRAEAERLANVAQIKADNCERSRRVLANLSTNGRLKVKGEDGNVRVLPEEERLQGIADAQRGIAANCDS